MREAGNQLEETPLFASLLTVPLGTLEMTSDSPDWAM